MLTGESLPVSKEIGARVYAATQNQDGMLRCRATGVGSHTLLADIIRLVEQAQGSKAPIQRLADAISGILRPDSRYHQPRHLRAMVVAGWQLH